MCVVSGTGSLQAGFVFGPPIIGELASATSLTAALGILPVLTACIAYGSRRSILTD